ncbi:MAG: hypothetical protein ABI415_01925, partial [Flavitalea sp.]
MKKILKIILVAVLIIIALLFTLPFVFKGKIISIVKTQVNKKINAKVDFSDIGISLLRSFPKVSVALENITVVG